MIVKAEGPSGTAKINSDGPKHALGLVQYLRTIGYEAWIEDADGNEIEETVNACVPALQSKYERLYQISRRETSQQPRTRWQEYAKAFVPKDCGR